MRLDSKGFLVMGELEPERQRVVLELTPRGMGIVARLCREYLDEGVPLFDCQIETAPGELDALHAEVMNQLLGQGVVPNEDDEDKRADREGTLVERVADRFVALLRRDLGPVQWAQMVRRNRGETSPNVCRSHDFLDANMVMLEAIRAEGGCTDVMSEDHADLHNAAWEAARGRLRGE